MKTRLLTKSGLKPVPVIVTFVSTGPVLGVKPERMGAGAWASTTKFSALVAVRPLVSTLSAPVDAPTGTVTTRRCALAALTAAATPLKRTVLFAGVVLKPEPVTVTSVPEGPELGVNSKSDRSVTDRRLISRMLPPSS